MSLYDDDDDIDMDEGDAWSAPSAAIEIKEPEKLKVSMPAFFNQTPNSRQNSRQKSSSSDLDGVDLDGVEIMTVTKPQISPTALAPATVNPLQRRTMIQQNQMRTQKSDDLGHVVDLNNQAERKRKQLLEETARKMAAEAKRIRTPKNSIATPVVCTANGTLLHVRPKIPVGTKHRILGKSENSLGSDEYDPRTPNKYLELRPKPKIVQEKHGKTRAEAILKKLNAQASIGTASETTESSKENRTRFSDNADNTVENSRLVAKSAVPGYDSDSSDDYRPSGGAQIAPPTFLQEKGPELRPGSSGTLATARKAKKIVPLFQRAKMNPENQAKKLNRDTTVLCIKNSVGPGEVDDDLKTDFRAECSKFGKVLDIKLFDVSQMPGMEDSVEEENAVRIFVKYQNTQSSRQAFDALDGRFFAGRTLKCAFFGLAQFDRNELAGLV
jgi:hypothetical protein